MPTTVNAALKASTFEARP